MVGQKFVFLILGLLLIGPLLAGPINVLINVDHNQAAIGDALNLQIIVQGVQGLSSRPKMKIPDGFEIVQGGTSSQFQSINGETSVSTIYSYSVYPQKVGTFSLGPAEIDLEGQLYRSNSLQIVVEKERDQLAQERTTYIETTVDQPSPYLNQQIIYTFRFFRRADIRKADLALPNFDGFWKVQLGKQREFQTTSGGAVWDVTEIKYALFPSQVGTVTIPPATLGLVVMERADGRRKARSGDSFGFRELLEDEGFFGHSGELKEVRLKSKPITLQVKDLPEEGKPDHFTGLVGQFLLKAQMSKQHLKVGESTTLTVEVRGDGQMRDVTIPELSFPDIKVYDDKPTLQQGGEDRLLGVKIVKKAIVPTNAGKITLPSFKIAYFNPSKGIYEVLSSPEFQLDVAPSDERSITTSATAPTSSSLGNGPSAKQEIRLLGQDLMPIMNLEMIENAKVPLPSFFAISFVIILGSPLLYLVCYGLHTRRKRLLNDVQGSLKIGAYKQLVRSLKKLNDRDPLFHGELSHIFRDYLAAKLGREGSSITVIDVEPLLRPCGITVELVEQVKSFLRECDMAQYGGGVTMSSEQLRQRVERLVKELEKKL